MLNVRNIGLCVLIVAGVGVALLILPSFYNLTTSELVVNDDNNRHSIAVQKMERIVQLLTVIKRVSLLYHSVVIQMNVHSVLQQ